ncbi:hypothetical protein Poli38472_004441 [Pythium oligandrum]|uniref:Cytochrome P450 n=1 Tax=Pythium oligandrum TaxID=41045 RepID=A0A8K1FH47_PYTOL|nr:hypothetical protein Poli38472_004441 [Pythium oligandrum]|eukprot:TMW59372.1 hypothetical protein Poli38472_004441 [Pythium oligandrum]
MLALPPTGLSTAIWTTFAVVGAFVVLRRLRRETKLPEGVQIPLELPGKLPVLGHTHFFAKNEHVLNDWLASQCIKYNGQPWRATIMGQPEMLVLSTPEAMEDVCKTHFDNFPKGAVQTDALNDLFGDGMLAVDGEKWYYQRKIARNLITMRALRDSMSAIVQKHTKTMVEILGMAADTQETLDIVRLFRELTIEAFAEIAFGIEMGSLGTEHEDPFHTAMDTISPLLVLRFRVPTWFWKLQRALGVGAEGELARNIKIVDDILLDVIQRSLASRVDKTPSPDSDSKTHDIISLFLDHGEEQLTAKTLRDIVLVFLVAGRDTSADSLSWFWYLLQKHPHVEQAIRDELDAKLANNDSLMSMAQVNELVYLEAALRETLRLYPAAAFVNREAACDTVLSDGTFVRKGMRIGLSSYALGRLPSVWGEDAAEFRPERWIDPETKTIIQVSPFKFMAFHAGPRMCMGATLAMLQMKIIAAKVLTRFHVDVLPDQDMTQEIGLTLAIKNGLRARVRRV